VGIQRRDRRRSPHRRTGCDAAPRAGAPMAPASPDPEARIVTLRDGSRWLVTVVARLVSEDTDARLPAARLVLRFACLGQPRRPVRVATVSARSLHAVDDETLRSLATVPAARSRPAAITASGGAER